jgi:hypothetical protein
MEDCMICFNNKSNKVLPCSHSLCSNCCVRLNVSICPYCRQVFIFNSEEINLEINDSILSSIIEIESKTKHDIKAIELALAKNPGQIIARPGDGLTK